MRTHAPRQVQRGNVHLAILVTAGLLLSVAANPAPAAADHTDPRPA